MQHFKAPFKPFVPSILSSGAGISPWYSPILVLILRLHYYATQAVIKQQKIKLNSSMTFPSSFHRMWLCLCLSVCLMSLLIYHKSTRGNWTKFLILAFSRSHHDSHRLVSLLGAFLMYVYVWRIMQSNRTLRINKFYSRAKKRYNFPLQISLPHTQFTSCADCLVYNIKINWLNLEGTSTYPWVIFGALVYDEYVNEGCRGKQQKLMNAQRSSSSSTISMMMMMGKLLIDFSPLLCLFLHLLSNKTKLYNFTWAWNMTC